MDPGSAEWSLSDDYNSKYDPNDQEFGFDNDGALYTIA